jgi:AcrR family transcriptional regulator
MVQSLFKTTTTIAQRASVAPMTNTVPTPRDELLQRIVVDVAQHGLGNRSLRELASAVRTSHRMLLYHFGSRDGLVAAIVGFIEQDQRRVLLELAAEATEPADLARALWQRVSAPELRPFVRLFFESVAHASATGDEVTLPWIDSAAEAATAMGVRQDPVDIRLGVAVTRGLLVDLLSGGELAAANRAFERYLEIWTAADGMPDRH